MRHAQRALDVNPRNPWALAILRDADLQSDHYDAALTRYEKAYPELFVQGSPRIDRLNAGVAIDLALALQKRGDTEGANLLLDNAEAVIRTLLDWAGTDIRSRTCRFIRFAATGIRRLQPYLTRRSPDGVVPSGATTATTTPT